MANWAERIGSHVSAEGSVIVPGRIAAWLEKKAGVTADRRIMLRDCDPLAYEVLMALHLVALQHGSEDGTKVAAAESCSRESEWLTTAEAATELGITERAIRKRITTGRLPARRRGWQWQINRQDLHVQALVA